MARQINRLSARSAATLKAAGWHADGAGLYLRIDTAGRKRWVFVYQAQQRRRELGLGGFPDISLAQAREAREAARGLLRAGKDPLEEKRRPAPSAVPTFGELAETVIAELELGWKNPKQGKLWRRSLQLYAKPLLKRPVDQITTEDVLAILKPIWARISETASRVRGRIEHILDAAKVKGFRTGENPARWKGHLSMLLARRQKLAYGHRPAMPYQDVPAFMARLLGVSGNGPLALRFTILTVVRENEALGARIGEIDRETRTWTIPGGRMGRMKGTSPPAHRVPMSEAAWAIVEERLTFGDDPEKLLFPGARKGRPLSNMTMDMVIRRLGVTGATVHGFRSSFRDWAGELTSFPREVAEAALAHQITDEAERAYRRGDALEKRRKLMEAWANYLTKPRGDVVQLGRSIRPGQR